MSGGNGNPIWDPGGTNAAQRANNHAVASEQQRQAQIDQDIGDLNASYGIGGDDPGARPTPPPPRPARGGSLLGRGKGPALDPTANNRERQYHSDLNAWGAAENRFAAGQGNAARIKDTLDRYQSDVLSTNNRALDSSYGTARKLSRQQLASQGLLNSSVDFGNQRQNLSQYVAGRQRAVQASTDARTNLQHSFDTTRQQTQQQIQTGALVNPSFQDTLNNQQFQVESARSNVVPSAIGAGFTVAGDLYSQDQTAQGLGYNGFGGSSSSTPKLTTSSTGTIGR